MKNKNLICAIATSLYSPSFYREVCQRWRGRSFAYLLMLLAICWLFISFSKTIDVCLTLNHLGTVAEQQMPTIKAENGVLTSKVKQPVLLKWRKNAQPFAVIDLTNQFKNFEGSSAQILVGSNHIILKKDSHQINTYYFPKTLSGMVGPNTINGFLTTHAKGILGMTFFAIFMVGLLFSYIWYIVLALIYTLLGMIFVAVMKAKINHGALLGMTLVVLTPAILLQTLFIVAGVSFAFQYIVYFIISMLYLFFAIKTNKSRI